MTEYPSLNKPWLKYFNKEADKYVVEDTNQSAYQYILKANKNNLDYIALEYFNTKITYRDLFNNINKIAKSLKAFSISKGDYVTLCLPNIPEIVYFVYALNRIGAVACLIDPRTNSEGILERANNSNSKLVIAVTDILKEKIIPISEQFNAKAIIGISPANSTTIYSAKGIAVKLLYLLKNINKCKYSSKFINYKIFLEMGKIWNAEIDGKHTKGVPAIVVYTSGTTGSSKGVMLSNENMISSKRLIEYGVSKVTRNASFLGVIPFFSSYGAFTGMNNSLCSGWKIILIPRFKPEQFGKLLIKHKAVSALGVPRFWSDFAGANLNIDLSFLKNPVCGGDKISPSEVLKINRYLLSHNANRLKIGYGASEFGGGIAITTENGPYDKNSTGEILPGVIGMVIDPDTGKEMKYNESGELCFYSPTMMSGYLNNDKETNNLIIIKDGVKFYRTGDKGFINENGCVFIVGRYKRVMMRPDGHTVHATSIENIIMEHAAVESCAVVGLPLDSGAGVIPTAFIKLNNQIVNSAKIIDEIDELCTRKIPERDKAHAYIIIDTIPYTPMGKVDYRALEKYCFSDADFIVKDRTFLK